MPKRRDKSLMPTYLAGPRYTRKRTVASQMRTKESKSRAASPNTDTHPQEVPSNTSQNNARPNPIRQRGEAMGVSRKPLLTEHLVRIGCLISCVCLFGCQNSFNGCFSGNEPHFIIPNPAPLSRHRPDQPNRCLMRANAARGASCHRLGAYDETCGRITYGALVEVVDVFYIPKRQARRTLGRPHRCRVVERHRPTSLGKNLAIAHLGGYNYRVFWAGGERFVKASPLEIERCTEAIGRMVTIRWRGILVSAAKKYFDPVSGCTKIIRKLATLPSRHKTRFALR